MFHPPSGWKDAAPPSLGLPADGEVTIDATQGWQSPAGDARASLACVGMDLHTWTDEAVPVATARLDGMVGAVASRLDGNATLHVVREDRSGGVVQQWLGADGKAPVARTMLGFVDSPRGPRLDACFVLCAPADDACTLAVDAAAARGFVAPPPATAWLRAVVAGAHHPRAVAMGTLALFVLFGIVLVWRRPRVARK